MVLKNINIDIVPVKDLVRIPLVYSIIEKKNGAISFSYRYHSNSLAQKSGIENPFSDEIWSFPGQKVGYYKR